MQQNPEKEQFLISDNRSLREVIDELLAEGYIPSFCTACYRKGRTGEHFMEFSVPGFIKRYCTPNALLTLAEYLESPQVEIVVSAMVVIREYVQCGMLMAAAEECYSAIEKVPGHLPLHTQLADILLMQVASTLSLPQARAPQRPVRRRGLHLLEARCRGHQHGDR
jgi:hypothetical protein